MNALVIVKLGSTFPELAAVRGDFEDWVKQGLGPVSMPVRTIDPVRGEQLPPYEGLLGVVVTGSHAMVTDRHPWSEQTARWLVGLLRRQIPLFAICYGHQLLGHALGCPVGDSPHGPEEGTVALSLTSQAAEDPLFAGLPNPLWVQVSHRQSVLELPAGAVLLAQSQRERHHAYRLGRCAWGVQFHPEFDPEIQIAYIRHAEEELRTAGYDPNELVAQIRPTPEAATLLRRFVQLCMDFSRLSTR